MEEIKRTKYQCVEYVKRFYTSAMDVKHEWDGTGDAITYYNKANDKGLISYPNGGSVAPKPDDILVFGVKNDGSGTAGHVAIITEVGDDYVKIIEQNYNRNNANATLTLRNESKNYSIPPRRVKEDIYRPILGWCRTPTLNITSPTEKSFSSVGSFDDPKPLKVEVEVKCENSSTEYLPIEGLDKDDFIIKIGDKKVNDVTINDVGKGEYIISFDPPQQKSGGKCDLNVSVKYKKITLRDSEQNAVRYGGTEETVKTRDTVLVLDASGSMGGTPVTVLKEAAKIFCSEVLNASGNRVAIVVYSDRVEKTLDFTSDLDSLNSTIDSIRAGGGTNIGAALDSASSILSSSDADAKNIVLMTDGLPQSGSYKESGRYSSSDISTYYRYANYVYEQCSELKQSYNIYTLGFFHGLYGKELEFGHKFLNDIQNKGYYEVTDASKLKFIFGELAEDITKEDYPIIVVHGMMGGKAVRR